MKEQLSSSVAVMPEGAARWRCAAAVPLWEEAGRQGSGGEHGPEGHRFHLQNNISAERKSTGVTK